VNGAFDLADHIYQCRGKKPITAMVNESCYSAAYLIASAASKIILPRTGGAGSIGVIATHVDQSVWNEKTGLAVTHVFAGARKADMTPHRPLSSEAMERLQEMVTDTYKLFVDTVARNRGMSKQAVIDTEAGIYAGKKAVFVGLADEVATVDKTMARLARTRGGMTMPGAKAEQDQAATTEATPATEKMFTQADLDAAVTDAKVGMISEADAKQLATKAAAAERTRIMAIHASCQGSNAGKMFVNLVNDGCTEQQANTRIQDALAMASDALDIQSHHGGGGGAPKAKIDTAEIYSRVK
jgi:signal peptide peptidase SppA